MNEPHTLAKLASSTFNAINVDPLNVLSLSGAPPASASRRQSQHRAASFSAVPATKLLPPPASAARGLTAWVITNKDPL